MAVAKYALCTLEEARQYLKLTTGDHDDWLADLIDMVSASIELYTKRKLASRIYDGGSGNEGVMKLSGRGSADIGLREFPVTAVTEALVRYDDGTTTRTLNITGARLLYGGRRLWLPYDSFPAGESNIELKCTAGYLAGTHDSELRTLKLGMLRCVQVSWQDRELALGRGTTFGVGDQSVSVLPDDLPKDVKTLLRPFERW